VQNENIEAKILPVIKHPVKNKETFEHPCLEVSSGGYTLLLDIPALHDV
jgi:hypothetical protein